MVNFKKILVPLDGSKKSFEALDNAIYIAKLCNAEVTGVHILPNLVVAGMRTQRIENQMLSEGKTILKTAKERSVKNNVPFSQEIFRGNPGQEITKYGKKKNFDLIVMSSTGTGAQKEAFFGSISNYVMHTSEIPVLIIR